MGIKITADQIQIPRNQGWGIVHMIKGQRVDVREEHSHPYDEYVIILNGHCILRNAGKDIEYRTGDIGYFPHHQAHRSVEALRDTTYIWTRGDTLPEFAHEPEVMRGSEQIESSEKS